MALNATRSATQSQTAVGFGILTACYLLSLRIFASGIHFKGSQVLTPPEPKMVESAPGHGDLRDIKGQETAKRALEVTAAGGHNLLMIGPPGAGKSMLAARLPALLPALDASETLEVSMIASVAGILPEGGLTRRRPFRDPHHTASNAAMIGGGTRAKPGEVSLAHLGVLFLDELPEFPRQVLESLRQPMETGRVTVARANAHVTYPARIQVVAAMNPCPCGFFNHPTKECVCSPSLVARYQKRISGPLLDWSMCSWKFRLWSTKSWFKTNNPRIPAVPD